MQRGKPLPLPLENVFRFCHAANSLRLTSEPGQWVDGREDGEGGEEEEGKKPRTMLPQFVRATKELV